MALSFVVAFIFLSLLVDVRAQWFQVDLGYNCSGPISSLTHEQQFMGTGHASCGGFGKADTRSLFLACDGAVKRITYPTIVGRDTPTVADQKTCTDAVFNELSYGSDTCTTVSLSYYCPSTTNIVSYHSGAPIVYSSSPPANLCGTSTVVNNGITVGAQYYVCEDGSLVETYGYRNISTWKTYTGVGRTNGQTTYSMMFKSVSYTPYTSYMSPINIAASFFDIYFALGQSATDGKMYVATFHSFLFLPMDQAPFQVCDGARDLQVTATATTTNALGAAALPTVGVAKLNLYMLCNNGTKVTLYQYTRGTAPWGNSQDQLSTWQSGSGNYGTIGDTSGDTPSTLVEAKTFNITGCSRFGDLTYDQVTFILYATCLDGGIVRIASAWAGSTTDPNYVVANLVMSPIATRYDCPVPSMVTAQANVITAVCDSEKKTVFSTLTPNYDYPSLLTTKDGEWGTLDAASAVCTFGIKSMAHVGTFGGAPPGFLTTTHANRLSNPAASSVPDNLLFVGCKDEGVSVFSDAFAYSPLSYTRTCTNATFYDNMYGANAMGGTRQAIAVCPVEEASANAHRTIDILTGAVVFQNKCTVSNAVRSGFSTETKWQLCDDGSLFERDRFWNIGVILAGDISARKVYSVAINSVDFAPWTTLMSPLYFLGTDQYDIYFAAGRMHSIDAVPVAPVSVVATFHVFAFVPLDDHPFVVCDDAFDLHAVSYGTGPSVVTASSISVYLICPGDASIKMYSYTTSTTAYGVNAFNPYGAGAVITGYSDEYPNTYTLPQGTSQLTLAKTLTSEGCNSGFASMSFDRRSSNLYATCKGGGIFRVPDAPRADYANLQIEAVATSTDCPHPRSLTAQASYVTVVCDADGKVAKYSHNPAVRSFVSPTLTPTTIAPTPTTLAPTTLAPTTQTPSTPEPTTPQPTTTEPTTPEPTTPEPTTQEPTTLQPTTTTPEPTTAEPTVLPTTYTPTTLPPTTPAPTTFVPTTNAPTTHVPTTATPTTAIPNAWTSVSLQACTRVISLSYINVLGTLHTFFVDTMGFVVDSLIYSCENSARAVVVANPFTVPTQGTLDMGYCANATFSDQSLSVMNTDLIRYSAMLHSCANNTLVSAPLSSGIEARFARTQLAMWLGHGNVLTPCSSGGGPTGRDYFGFNRLTTLCANGEIRYVYDAYDEASTVVTTATAVQDMTSLPTSPDNLYHGIFVLTRSGEMFTLYSQYTFAQGRVVNVCNGPTSAKDSLLLTNDFHVYMTCNGALRRLLWDARFMDVQGTMVPVIEGVVAPEQCQSATSLAYDTALDQLLVVCSGQGVLLITNASTPGLLQVGLAAGLADCPDPQKASFSGNRAALLCGANDIRIATMQYRPLPPPSTAPPTTALPTTYDPTTEAPTTEAPTTIVPSTTSPTTQDVTTVLPSTVPPTATVASTSPPTTETPTTDSATTHSPTQLPTNATHTTEAPTTVTPTTEAATTEAPTTAEATTIPATTLAPTTLQPTTMSPTTTLPPTTLLPTTLPPTTLPPSTLPPTTLPPTTLQPTTYPGVTATYSYPAVTTSLHVRVNATTGSLIEQGDSGTRIVVVGELISAMASSVPFLSYYAIHDVKLTVLSVGQVTAATRQKRMHLATVSTMYTILVNFTVIDLFANVTNGVRLTYLIQTLAQQASSGTSPLAVNLLAFHIVLLDSMNTGMTFSPTTVVLALPFDVIPSEPKSETWMNSAWGIAVMSIASAILFALLILLCYYGCSKCRKSSRSSNSEEKYKDSKTEKRSLLVAGTDSTMGSWSGWSTAKLA